jgi:LTXXQ motif family protein
LQRLYDSLSDEQKQRFNTMGATANGGEQAGGDIATLCDKGSADATNLPVQRIQRVVQPNGADQENNFDALRGASRNAAEQLQASCPKQTPQTPVGRLDAVKKRLQAMVDAMNTVHPKLQALYSSLSDEQRARFNTMGPGNASSADERQGSNR